MISFEQADDGSVIKIENGVETNIGQIDDATGAPAFQRMLVGGITKQADRLATIRKKFPTAIVDPDDNSNFLFENPATGKLTRYNPKGLDWGDIPSMTREMFQMGGSIGGGTAGFVGGGMAGGVGAVPGAAAGSMLGAAGGEELFQLLVQALGAEDTRTPMERAGDTAFVGATGLGGPAGSAATAGVKQGVKLGIRGPSGEGVQQTIDDAAKFGFVPSAATATRNGTIDMLESLVSKAPGGFTVVRNAVSKAIESTKSKIDETVRNLAKGSVDATKVGRTVRGGIEDADGFISRFNARAGQLYDAIPIAADSPAAMTNTVAKLQELTRAIPGAEKTTARLTNQALSGMRDDLIADIGETGALPFEALKRLRSMVGERIANTSLIDSVSKGEWKQLYGALSEDIKAAASAAGPDARKAFDRAGAFWKAGTTRVDDILQPLINKNVPEDVARSIELGGKKGPTRLLAIRRSLTPAQWKVVAAQALSDMGAPQASKGIDESLGFSFDSFLTRWNNLDDKTLDALFGNMGTLKADLDSLVRVARSMRESSQAFANPSGTAGASVGQVMLFSSLGAPVTAAFTGDAAGAMMFPAVTAMAVLGTRQAAKLLTSPSFVKWLAGTSKVRPNGIGAHVGRLGQLATSGDLDFKQAVLEYANQFQADPQSP